MKRPYDRAARVPVLLPLVEVTVDENGLLAMLLDRKPYAGDGSLHRDDLPQLLEQIASDRGTPVRVEVHERDGSSFVDIVTPTRRTPASHDRSSAASTLGDVTGSGFIAGEDVAIAVVVARQVASEHGTACLRLPPALVASHPGLLLVGETSGTVTVSGAA